MTAHLVAYVPWTRAWRRRRHVALCRQTFRKVQQIVDGELPRTAGTDQLLNHLEDCAHCGAEADAVRDLKHSIERVEQRDTDELVRRLNPLLRRLLDEGG